MGVLGTSASDMVADPARTAPESVQASAPSAPRRRRWPYWLALAVVLAGALGLRLWGIKQGLPFVYNTDENNHFLPIAVGIFQYGWNPHDYFSNPPALTYLLHLVFIVWYGGRTGVSHALALNPTSVYVVARVTVALLGTVSVWLLYLVGARLFDRRVGLLASALMAVAFLPVFYAHQALNDVPTLAPLTLSLFGTAGVLRHGRRRDYLIAGIGLGLGCATKYTAGIVVLPLVAAAALQYLSPRGERAAVAGLAIALISALAFFLLANPYSVLDFHDFKNGLIHQSSVSESGTGKLGAPTNGGLSYYLWTFTWGLGWVPTIASVGGAVALWWGRRRLIVVLVPATLVFLAFMGIQNRYFGRWLLPIFPIICLLGAYFALQVASWAARGRASFLAPALIVLAGVVLIGQGLVYSVHSGLILSRADTRNEARTWMVKNIPIGTHIVVEPVVPDTWVQDPGHPSPQTRNGDRWIKWPSLRSYIDTSGALVPDSATVVNIEDYERTLSPALIPFYEEKGYCWVVTGFDQEGRALADPTQVPQAIAYYRALARKAQVAYSASPYYTGQGPVGFNFDWTFDYYNLAYARPGPSMTIYRLLGGRCATGSASGRSGTRAKA